MSTSKYYWNSGANDVVLLSIGGPKGSKDFSGNKTWPISRSDNCGEVQTTGSQENAAAVESSENMGYMEEFVSRVSIMGIMQIVTRKTVYWKLFWVVISLSSSAMAVFQSWGILQDFIGGNTVQSTSYSTVFEFPSVTLCSNIRIDYSHAADVNANDTLGLSKDNLTHLISYTDIILRLENETRQSFFGQRMQLRQCEFNKKRCDRNDEDDVYYFDTAMYGNCLTYNRATRVKKLSRSNFYLSLKISTDRLSRKLEWNDNYISVWIHPPGSAPVLYRHEGYHAYPGDSVDIKLQLKKVSRLPGSGSECIDAMTDKLRFSNIFYTNESTYIYTAKACVYSLIFDSKRATLGCLDPAVPRNDVWMSEWNTGNYNICLPGTSTEVNDEDDTNQTLFNFDENCTLPCSEWIVDYTVTSTSAWFEAMVDKSLKDSRPGNNDVRFDNRYVELKIGLGSPIVEEVTENYKYTTGDFAGIVGGNIGVWIGLSSISLAEIPELLVNFLVYKYQQFRNLH